MCISVWVCVMCAHEGGSLWRSEVFEAWELGLEVNVDALQEQYVPIGREPCLLLQDISKFFFFLFSVEGENSTNQAFQYEMFPIYDLMNNYMVMK